MSVQTPPRGIADSPSDADRAAATPGAATDGAVDASAGAVRHSSPTGTALVGGLAAAAAGWMAAGVFAGFAPRLVALAAAALGAGATALSYRARRPATLQYLAVPLAVGFGALLVVPDARSGSTSLPSLVAEAVRSGGLGQPPVVFDPGWKFLLAVLVTLLAAGASSFAAALDRPRLAVTVTLPVVFAATLVQPAGKETLSAGVALLLVVAALGVAYGIDLAREGAVSGQFELRRLAHGGGSMAALLAVLAVLARSGILLPEPRTDEVVPPRRPERPPPAVDRELFRVRSDRVLTWRLGVLDVYDDNAWMTPPFDPARFADVDRGGSIAGAPTRGESLEATFEVRDLRGRVVPGLAGARVVQAGAGDGSGGAAIAVDPRTGTLRLPDGRATSGLSYRITAAVPPSGGELREAAPPPERFAEFLAVPPPPDEVTALLAAAPQQPLFARLQHVREAYFNAVIAAGAGNPVDVPPARVGEMLQGKEATPYEITAGEALLARWAGVPSRIGFGYFGGDRPDGNDGPLSIRPKHGATWLEVYFEGFGWVPIVGTPPRAKSSLSNNEKNDDPSVRPTEDFALVTYVPVRFESIQLLYSTVRFWLVRVLPLALSGGLLIGFYPAGLKAIRRRNRRRWAEANGAHGRIAAAYAEFRDRATDANIGRPSQTPRRFLAAVEPDEEHTELAWLVTRALWGDLQRDLTDADALAAEELSRSVGRRMWRAQPALARMTALAARASLRTPFSDEVPNIWWSRPSWMRPRVAAPAAGLVAVALVLGLAGSGSCVQPLDLTASAGRATLPPDLVPATLDDLVFQREADAEKAYTDNRRDALVDTGQVYSVRRGKAVEASLQIAPFKVGLRGRRSEVIDGVLRSLGEGNFEPVRIGAEHGYALDLPEQRLLVWFAPDGSYFQLLVARRDFAGADRTFAALLARQRGEDPAALGAEAPPPVDPLRGWDR